MTLGEMGDAMSMGQEPSEPSAGDPRSMHKGDGEARSTHSGESGSGIEEASLNLASEAGVANTTELMEAADSSAVDVEHIMDDDESAVEVE